MSQDPQNPQAGDGKAGPGWDSPGPAGTATAEISNSEASGSVGESVKSLWRKTMDTSILAPIQGWFDSSNETLKQIAENETKAGHPIRAALANTYYGAQKIVTDTLTGVSTPSNATLAIASGGESAASQAVRVAAGIYFGWRGSQAMLQGRIDGETKTDEYVRRTEGALQAVAGGAGATEGGVGFKEAIRAKIQGNLGLSGDLAAKVQAKIEAAAEAEAQAAAKTAAIDKTFKADAGAIQQLSDKGAKSASQEIPVQLNGIMAQASQTVAMEQARFNTEYKKLTTPKEGEKALPPVTTADDLKAEIINSIKAHGVQDPEIAKIEGKIFAALPKAPTTSVRAPTSAELTASRVATSFSRDGIGPDEMRSVLLGQGYVPTQVDVAMSIAFPHMKPTSADVNFEMTRRVKNDLWNAAQSATDVETRNGLLDAQANVDGIRQRYADAQGFGPQHAKLNAEYMKFKREMGSGPMDEFLKAQDFSDQNLNLLTAKHLMNQDSAEGLRGLLNLAGVDTEPLRIALENQKAFADLPEKAISGLEQQAEYLRKQIQEQTGATVKAIGETNPIFPGQSDLALKGKGNLQIRLDAMREIADNARKSGITNPSAYIQIMFGIARAAFSSPLGGFSAMSGGTRLGMEKMLRSKGFQDWIAQESGVTPQAMPKLLKSLSKSYPFLEKMALSGVREPSATTLAAGALNKNNQQKTPLVMPAPGAPDMTPTAQPSGTPLRIAGTQ